MLDACGCLVLPGAIDVHTHVLGAIRDDTRSALVGGTTSALVFVDAEPGERPVEAARRALADEMPDALCDLAFHAVIWEPQAYRRGDLRDVAELGVGSVKLWLAYHELGIQADDDVAFAVMQEAAELGIVVLAHCENGRVIDVLTRQLIERGELGTESLPRSRPITLEAECVHRFLVLAELAGATPYVVHVSGRRSLDEIVTARRRGMTVYGEVCPHHLLFDVSDHAGPDAVRYVMTPPLRTADDRAALLQGLGDGALDTLASDHCHLRLDEKLETLGDFSKIPTGLPGIGARLPIGFTLPLSVERLVEVACGGAGAHLRAVREGRDRARRRCRPRGLGPVACLQAQPRVDRRRARLDAVRRHRRAGDVPVRARARRSRGRGGALRRHRPPRRLPAGGPSRRPLSYPAAAVRKSRSSAELVGSTAGGSATPQRVSASASPSRCPTTARR